MVRLGDLERRELERLRLRFLERERLRERLLLLDPLSIKKKEKNADRVIMNVIMQRIELLKKKEQMDDSRGQNWQVLR